MEGDAPTQFPSPLSVCFYGWNDLSCPNLKFSCFLDVPFTKSFNPKSEVWSDPDISNIVFAGTRKGVILSFKIYSTQNQIKRIEPLCFLFGHPAPISTIIKCKQDLYDPCVASLSRDGTVSLISVADQTIVKNARKLFSKDSQGLACHDTNSRLVIASQTFGTIEIADVYEEVLLMRIEGFTSTVHSLSSHGTLSAISCIDGSSDVFSISTHSTQCLYTFKRNDNPPCFLLFSPQLFYLLVISSSHWSVHISDLPIYQSQVDLETENDSYINGGWINDAMFFVQTQNGKVEIWKFNPEASNLKTSVIENIKTSSGNFTVKTKDNESLIKTQIQNESLNESQEAEQRNAIRPPQLVYQCNDVFGPIAITQEGFIISSKKGMSSSDSVSHLPSTIFCRDINNHEVHFDFHDIYNSDVVCRCAVGDPPTGEAKITNDFSIWFNNKKIGEHQGARMLYSQGQALTFFSLSKDGSIKAWAEDQLISTFYGLNEPISKVKYIREKGWIIIIGKRDSFSVINARSMQSVALCTGHNSPVVNVKYRNGLFHALCKSAMLYSWNIEGKLVSKRMSSLAKPTIKFGSIHTSETQPHSSIPLPKAKSRKSPSVIQSKSQSNHLNRIDNENLMPVHRSQSSANSASPARELLSMSSVNQTKSSNSFNDNQTEDELIIDENNENFYKIIPLFMSKCQTYAIVLDVFKFLTIYTSFSTFNIQTDPRLIFLVLLWKRHIGEAKVCIDIGQTYDLLKSLNFAISGDNFTVTIPINPVIFDNTPKAENNLFDDMKYNKKITFCFSPLTTAVHAIASSTLAQCFMSAFDNENLSIISSLSQTITNVLLENQQITIPPSFPVLASYLLFPSDDLKMIVMNALICLMNSFDNETSLDIISKIEFIFGDWMILLPFILIHCIKYNTLPKVMAKDAANNLFPVIIQRREMFELLITCFNNFSPFIPQIDGFFTRLILEYITKPSLEGQIIRLAIKKPFEFFNAAITCEIKKPEVMALISKMFERLINPDRTLLMTMVCHAINMLNSGHSFDLEEIFSIIMKNNIFFSFNKSYAAFGDEFGFIHFISMETGSNVWNAQKIEKGKTPSTTPKKPIQIVSFSPNGTKLVFVDSDSEITWVSVSPIGKQQLPRDAFKIFAYDTMPSNLKINEVKWKGEGKVIFYNDGNPIFTSNAPSNTFFKKVTGKFASLM